MANSITCPTCQTEIEVSEVMSAQLTTQIRQQMDAELAEQRRAIIDQSKELDAARKKLEDSRKDIDQLVREGVDAQRDQLVAEARKVAEGKLAADLQDRDEQLTEVREKLQQAQANELELRKKERVLKNRANEMELEVARKLDAERAQIRDDALKQADEERRLKDAEKEQQIVGMRKQIDELKRKAEQGSQQLQGEVQELALEDLLATSFPIDSIEPIGKGVRGGDVLQGVLDCTGVNCGHILWESKRTKNWSNAWLAKARDDQRSARAGCVVIVSETLPDGLYTFALVDCVWVCTWSCAAGLAAALRVSLIEVSKSKLAAQGQHQKMELVYNYLAGQEFQQRVAGVAEAFISMQGDLESERRSMQRMWSKREKQLQRAIENTSGLDGDLQGIIGASMPIIDRLQMRCVDHIAPHQAQLGEGGHGPIGDAER